MATGAYFCDISNSTINRIFPAGIWCQNDVVSTSMRRYHVASTLPLRHFHVMCALGNYLGRGSTPFRKDTALGQSIEIKVVAAAPSAF